LEELENKQPGKIFWPMRKELSYEFRTLHKGRLRYLCGSPELVKVVKY
jgi:hypothetical protein